MSLQRMGLLCAPLWDFHCPGVAVLEAPQPSSEPRPPGAFYANGSLYSRHGHRFLQQCDPPSGATYHHGCIRWLDTLHTTEQGKFIGFRSSSCLMMYVFSMISLEWDHGYLVASSL